MSTRTCSDCPFGATALAGQQPVISVDSWSATSKMMAASDRDRDFGAGLINALKALTAIRPR
jgi:hypothetical protein